MLGTPVVAGGLLLLFGGILPVRVLGQQPPVQPQTNAVVHSLNVSSCPGTVSFELEGH